jgi:iron complex transport system ATP-binding protein
VTALRGADVEVELGERVVLDGATVEVAEGEFVGIVGPNGCGKTTLLRALHRVLKPRRGSVLLGADDLWSLSARETARQIAVVAQEHAVGFDFTAAEVAAMGRIPHKRGFERDNERDHEIIYSSLDALGLAPLAHRPFNAMSGGERQRALIARALVQESSILLLDEPTNHLDIHYQLDVLHRVQSLRMTTVAALHDLNLAAAWCDRVYVLAAGRVVASGPPGEALTAEMVSEVFGVRATAFVHPVTGKHQLLFDRAQEATS